MAWRIIAVPAVLFLFSLVSWLLLKFFVHKIVRKLEKVLNLKIEIQSVRLKSLFGVKVEKEGFFKLSIEYLKISSKLFNPNCDQLLTILVGPTTLTILKYSRHKQSKENNENSPVNRDSVFKKNIGTSSWIFLLQFVSIKVESLVVAVCVSEISFVWSAEIKLKVETSSKSLCLKADLISCKLTALHDDSPMFFTDHDISINGFLFPGKPISNMCSKIIVNKFHVCINEDMVKHFIFLNKKQHFSESANIKLDVNSKKEDNDSKLLFQSLCQIPKISLSLNNIKVIYRSNCGRELETDWNCVLSWQRLDDGHLEAALDLLGLVVNESKICKIFLLKQLTLELNIGEEENVYKLLFNGKLDTCHLDLIYEEMNFWYKHFITEYQNYLAIKKNSSSPVQSKGNLHQLSSHLKVSLHFLFENCSCDFNMTTLESYETALCTIYIGLFKLDIKEAVQQKKCFFSEAENLYLYVNVDDVISDGFPRPCRLQHDTPSCLPQSERHVWGRLIEIGKLNINCYVDEKEMDCSFECVYFSLEYSSAMGHALLILTKKINLDKILQTKRELQIESKYQVNKESADGLKAEKLELKLSMCVKNINLFMLGEREGGYNSVLCKLNELILTSTPACFVNGEFKSLLVAQLNELENLKTGDSFMTLGQKGYSSRILDFSSIKASYDDKKGLDVNTEFLEISWTPNLHMCVYEQIEAFKLFLQHNSDIFTKDTADTPKKHNPKIYFVIQKTTLNMCTCEPHSFGMSLKDFSIELSSDTKHFVVSECRLYFNKVEVFYFENVCIKQLSSSYLLSSRSKFKNIQPENIAWSIYAHEMYATFPYGFCFGDSLEKLQLVIKMVIKLHKKSKPPDLLSLPPDLLFLCKNFSFEVEDDPFEVRLGDNYMLLADENEQAIEREQKLEAKLEEIKTEKGTSISTKKLEELRKSLKERNALIYIRRSKEMYDDRPQRKLLFVSRIKDLELAVHSDHHLNKKENILQEMENVDERAVPKELEFSTLWARMVNGKFDILKVQIRDYPQSLIFMENFSARGLVIGAEVCATQATYEVFLPIGHPWNNIAIKKNMSPQKFFYDLKWDMSTCQLGYGGNFEPAFSMVSASFDNLTKTSLDISPPLPVWDKIRILFHGKLKADVADLNILLSASDDPYNTTEKLEIEWSAATFEWTNGNINIDGDFDMSTRNASKYDDSKVLHFPGFKLNIQLEWLCEGDANDHYVAIPTNPIFVQSEKHDSYQLFRSTNLNMNVTMDISSDLLEESVKADPPSVLLYASTLRWFQNFQAVVISRVSRPIKRGSLFKNTKLKKPAFGRHLKLVTVDLKFPCLDVRYWGSFEQERGLETKILKGVVTIGYQVFISPHPDTQELIRRSVANWIIRGLNSSFEKVRFFLLQSVESKLRADDAEDELLCIDEEGRLKKHYFFSVKRVDYKRQSSIVEDSFIHKIMFYKLKGAWTAVNRELVFGLLEAYSKMQMLKKVLSSDALKVTDKSLLAVQRQKSHSLLDSQKSWSSLTGQSSHGLTLLQKLVDEQASKFIVSSEEGDNVEYELEHTIDSSGTEDDIILKNLQIELINSQVLLHGTETKGSIVVTSGNASIFKRLHKPVFADVINKLNKVTWCGKFRNLQYFSTVENFKDITVDNIPWLTSDIIAGDNSSENNDLPNINAFTKASDAVGAFVEVRVQGVVHQLQRVISRCSCEFMYVNLDDEIDPLAEEYVPSVPSESTEYKSNDLSMASSLTLKHGKLEMSTNSSQYSVISDVVQNLILYTDPKKKKEDEKLEKMKFKLHLTAGKDLKLHVTQLQTRVRRTQMMLRMYERKLFEFKKQEDDFMSKNLESSKEFSDVLRDLQDQIKDTKDQLFDDVEELKILINAYGDVNVSSSPQKGSTSSITRKIDICFDDLQWIITQQDGQLGIANIFIRRFLYNQLTFTGNSIENLFEVGHFSVKNLLPGELYREALVPYEANIRRRVDKTVMLRIYCRVSPAVAGILIKEHFEVNVCPIAVRLTHKLFVNIEAFLFPKTLPEANDQPIDSYQSIQLGVRLPNDQVFHTKDGVWDSTENLAPKKPPQRPPPPRNVNTNLRKNTSLSTEDSVDGSKIRRSCDTNDISTTSGAQKGPSVKRSASSHSVSSEDRDVNTMKERAAKNQTFIYVKIPEVPVCFSYKGEKERNIEDAHDFNLCLPTLEYQSRTWTWQDLFQAMKKDYIRILVPQILKEKLHLKSAGVDTKPSIAQTDDTNKAKLLLGEKEFSQQKKSSKRLFGKLLKSAKSASAEKINDQGFSSKTNEEQKQVLMGKGVEPNNLQHAFHKLRDFNSQKN
ncbi:bridge-like lipid transfer protein family member 2 isoform X1 [Hydra vulgaris]|uniref:bridge-like lipid transfer protein family member 2 isoform X1 n=1 Tax=Hydra vulgaris TaxID=6087 RepID=UPI001F5FB962|nr:protein KIAA0100-like [Hydra vulgaris]